ncbi:protein HESO1 isoform X2 [Morus notabilis]|nr:protein HESO1 isoform X2 [Morus notabilis]XP_024029236.1 protein HESO1 isoform X2 [Morus notabilis]
MSGKGVLEHTLKEILVVLKPISNDWLARFQIINEIRGVVGSLESLKGASATVEPFGSFLTNLFTRRGDLDISIEINNGLLVPSSGKLRKLIVLRDLMKTMRERGGWNKFQFVPSARIPVLKVESNIRNIICDISVDNLRGQMKCKIVRWICEIDPRFRDMILLVKEWAKVHNINDSKAGTLSSYSLTLLVIFHFQTCQPPIFPPLKDIFPGNVSDYLTGLRADTERHIAETCAENIFKFKSDRQRAVNQSSLSELYISFFAKFSDIRSWASEFMICPHTGQWENRKGNRKWLHETSEILIEDPLARSENSAGGVKIGQLIRISEAFESTRDRFMSANLKPSSILDMLVQQQTFQSVDPRHNASGYQPSRPQRQTTDLSSILDILVRQQIFQSVEPRHNTGGYQPSHPQWQTTEDLYLRNAWSIGGNYQPSQPHAGQMDTQVQSLLQDKILQSLYCDSTTAGPCVPTYHDQASKCEDQDLGDGTCYGLSRIK